MADALPGFGAELWVALFAIQGTPPEIVARLHAESVKALADPESVAKLRTQGAEAVASTPEELGTLLQSEVSKWKDIVIRVGVKAE